MNEMEKPIQQLIASGQLDQASKLLESLHPQTAVEKRMSGHFRGIILNRQGRAQEARATLEQTLMLHGENIRLLRDLAVIYHEMHEMHMFRATQSRLEFTLQEHWAKLSFISRFNVQMMLAKFREEDGRVAVALHNYRQLLDLSDRDQRKGSRELVLAQLLRALALYKPTESLHAFYSELITLSAGEYTQEVNFEVAHSLMLAEMVMVGPEHAWIRVSQVLENPKAIEADKRLFYFDFLEGCLANGYTIPLAAHQAADRFQKNDLYEEQLRTLAFKGVGQVSLQELVQLASRLCWSSYVRILCVVANLQTDELQRLELQKKVLILIGSLDEESQILWKRRLKDVFHQSETRLEFSALRRSLYFSGNSLDLSRKKGMLQLLEHLAQSPRISVDEAIRKLWNSDFSPDHYHRLRMMVHRLNRLVHDFTTLGKIIEVDSESVRLRPGVQISAQEQSSLLTENLIS